MKRLLFMALLTIYAGATYAETFLDYGYQTLRKNGYHDVYRLVKSSYQCPEKGVDFSETRFIAISPAGNITDGVVCHDKVFEKKSTKIDGILVLK